VNLKEIVWKGADWNCLAQNGDQREAGANIVKRPGVLERAGTNRDSAVWC
jgi:hypothetical protein